MATVQADLDIVLGAKISKRHVAAVSSLPLKPDATIIDYGTQVVLEPYREAVHAAPLWALLNGEPALSHPAYAADALVWLFLPGGLPASLEDFQSRMRSRAEGKDSTTWIMRLRPQAGGEEREGEEVRIRPERNASTTEGDVASWPMVGTVSLIASVPEHLRVEVAFIAVTPAYQGTPAAAAATYALVRHCIEVGYRRVEWKTHVNNKRSRQAAERMGFVAEGIFRCHILLLPDYHSRDTAWYSIIEPEWEGQGKGQEEGKEKGTRTRMEAWLNSPQARQLFKTRQEQLKAMTVSGSPVALRYMHL